MQGEAAAPHQVAGGVLEDEAVQHAPHEVRHCVVAQVAVESKA